LRHYLELVRSDQFSELDRKLIQQILNSRFLKLLEQGRIEIKKARELFMLQKSSPPLSIGMPLHAGSISWARSLLQRAHVSLSGFQQLLPFMLAYDEGKELCDIFSQLESSVQQYEAANIEKLSKSVGSDLMDVLKHPLLTRDKVTSMLFVNMDVQLLVFVPFCYTEHLSNKLNIELQELMAFVRTTTSSLARVIDCDHSACLDQNLVNEKRACTAPSINTLYGIYSVRRICWR
jgi:hypothetical protein